MTCAADWEAFAFHMALTLQELEALEIALRRTRLACRLRASEYANRVRARQWGNEAMRDYRKWSAEADKYDALLDRIASTKQALMRGE